MLFFHDAAQNREQLLPASDRPSRWVGFIKTAACVVASTITILLFVQFVSFQLNACGQPAYAPCNDGCCMQGSTCKAHNGTDTCVPDCLTELWGNCSDKCCPIKSVCIPRSDTFSQCVPVVPRTLFFWDDSE